MRVEFYSGKLCLCQRYLEFAGLGGSPDLDPRRHDSHPNCTFAYFQYSGFVLTQAHFVDFTVLAAADLGKRPIV